MNDATAEAKKGSIVIGIDCAKRPSQLGVAIGSVSRTSVVIKGVFLANDKELGKRRGRERFQTRLVRYLAELLQENCDALLALDAPLGWPDGMRSELPQHRAGVRISRKPELMFRRQTDLYVKKETGQTPLTVGADWIAWIAHDALNLLGQIRAESGLEIPLAWSQGPLTTPSAIEVYPATEILAHKLSPTGYKGKESRHQKAREAIVKSLESDGIAGTSSPSSSLKVDRLSNFRKDLEENDHLLDAVLCVCSGGAFLRGGCVDLPSEHASASRREGWIWFNKRAVQDGTDASSRDCRPKNAAELPSA